MEYQNLLNFRNGLNKYINLKNNYEFENWLLNHKLSMILIKNKEKI